MSTNFDNVRIAIIGLGYVGLPLAVEFGKKFQTVGYDINTRRVDQLIDYIDVTLECSSEELASSKNLQYTADKNEIRDCNVYIITVPTPIDDNKQPDLTPLISASELVGEVISKNDVVIYESTVYPGATEDDCVPVIENTSNLTFNKDFFVGYSPERINPGDKERKVTTIKKVTSGSTDDTAKFVDGIYNEIIEAGTHLASSIKVAEASKVIENVQRDVNIALVNELHQIFTKLDINTKDVIEAASTKWNFMKLMPGLVGGHCIGVDPYYLLHKSQKNGYIPDLMRTARIINDGMAEFCVNDFVNKLIKKKINPVEAKVLVLGFTFKENCPDIRNTKVIDLINSLLARDFVVDVYDPVADAEEVKTEYGLQLVTSLSSTSKKHYDVAILAVGHDEIVSLIKNDMIKTNQSFIYDLKNIIK